MRILVSIKWCRDVLSTGIGSINIIRTGSGSRSCIELHWMHFEDCCVVNIFNTCNQFSNMVLLCQPNIFAISSKPYLLSIYLC